MFQCYETTSKYGVWNFHLVLFQFVSKHLETSESLDLEIFTCFNLLQQVYYKIYMFQCFEKINMGSGIFTFLVSVCFEKFETE